MTVPTTAAPPNRIQLRVLFPTVDDGRYPVKRCVGDVVHVGCDVFRDGHDLLRTVVRWRGPGDADWQEADMVAVDAHYKGVRWEGRFPVDRQGRWEFGVQSWTDRFATWRDEFRRKVEGGQQDLSGELSEGILLLREAQDAAPAGEDRDRLARAIALIEDPATGETVRNGVALDEHLAMAVERHAARVDPTDLPEPLAVEVDRVRARFGSWYELFPRSFGGLKGVEAQLPRLAELGFDVLYLPPIHPIGRKNRKGRNTPDFPGGNPVAAPDEPGSPWAIGAAEGGHDAVHPELGTIDDVRSLCSRASEYGIDIALDMAIQCSADHPWLTEHPEWFNRRPDGTLKYAENPPKKYQDIYNLNWDTPAWRELWEELRRMTLQWVDCGVKVFRVDNPHTKPFPFWEWLIREVHAVDRDVIFLAEAFTRRSVMRQLAKIGFTQSYTYFTWKTSRWDLMEYVNELAHGPEKEYFRPNFFANTPDILHESLVHGGPPMFTARLVLAGTLSPTYGIYSGYENFENEAVRPGSEEYRDSEKYVIKQRSLDGPLLPFVERFNRIRRENPALQELSNITFLETENEGLIAYAKRTGDNLVICVVSLDAHHGQEGVANIPAHLGTPPAFRVHDLITDEWHEWRIGRNYVHLWPPTRMAHIFRVEGW